MGLEPAEDADVRTAGRTTASAHLPEAFRTQACGYTPAELHRTFPGGPDERRGRVADVALQALTKGQGNPASSLSTKANSLGIYDAVMPGGRRLPMLKTLLTSACERNCYYCPFRAGRDFRRVTFKPEEMAKAFIGLQRSGVAQGLFLSSGIAGGGARTQDRLLDTAEILRRRLRYRGYLHLKLMPGVERDQVLRAMQLSDRVSINLEAPNAQRLARLAPQKVFFEELLRPLQWAEEIRRSQSPQHAWQGRWSSTVTQFVVGAAGESDVEILSISERLTRELHLSRVYFSAFSPVPDTPLENHPPETPLREHRLYQSSFLLRDYGFEFEELPFDARGHLPLETDPKLAWAQQTLSDAPVDINRAERHELLRVPGIGQKGAAAILMARRRGALHELGDLAKLGVLAARAAPFVLLDGRRPAHQQRMF